MIKIVIAGLLSAALIILAPPTQAQTPSQLNNSTRSAKAQTVQAQLPRKATTGVAITAVAQEKAPTEPPTVVARASTVSEVEPKPPIYDVEATAKAFIYQHESGNDPTALNAKGCYGLGQDCNGIVKHQCGANYSCQDHYFTQYMLRRYGTWRAAKSHWLARVPINGRDVGHWW